MWHQGIKEIDYVQSFETQVYKKITLFKMKSSSALLRLCALHYYTYSRFDRVVLLWVAMLLGKEIFSLAARVSESYISR
jgi:hypothetical protein